MLSQHGRGPDIIRVRAEKKELRFSTAISLHTCTIAHKFESFFLSVTL